MYVVLNRCIHLFQKNPTVFFFLVHTQTHYYKIHMNT